ncbi:MAG: hypothetical protein DRG78_03200 [Epsilonproteobacteria bacterium]|nr:MAG: hypothetical protein DRG78_03200 [Campylobacterota bacterium]
MFKNLTISVKLNVNLFIVILGLIILGLNSFFSLSNLNKEYQVSNQLATKASDLKSILIGGLLYNSATGVVATNPQSKKAQKTMKDGANKVQSFFKKLKKESSSTCNNIAPQVVKFIKVSSYMHDKAINNSLFSKNDIKNSLKSWREVKFKIMPQLKQINKNLTISNKNYDNLLQSMLIESIVAILIIALITSFLSFFIAMSVKRPLVKLTNSVIAMIKFSSADQKIEIESNDETGQLASHFNDYLQKLRDTAAKDQQIVEEVDKAIQMARAGFFVYTVTAETDNRTTNDLKNSVNDMIMDLGQKFNEIDKALISYGNANFDYKFNIENISGTLGSIVFGTKAIGSNISELLATIMISGEQLSKNIDILSTSANSLSDSANAQAASLEETAAAVEEISSNIKSSSKNVTKMSALSTEVTASATSGQNLASQTAKSMDDINHEVNAISEAIGVIDQIAFQTNILSLNAAVEAATAGEAGKGFAVVAQEVRNLAARSADAANEIKTLVDSANIKANQGKKIADEMISGYSKLNDKISQNKEMIDMVSLASNEQTKGISQINDAINILDKNTQENASDATNIGTLSKEVESLSQRLLSVSNNAKYREEARSQVCDVDMVYKLNKLKLDHLHFKTSNFAKLNERTTFKVPTENECELAKWIKDQENQGLEYTKSANWKELNDAHALVHSGVQKYIDQNAALDSNNHLLKTGNDIEHATGRVFVALNIVKKENCTLQNK